MKGKFIFFVLMFVGAIFIVNCDNIYDFTHSDGEGDDPETLIIDGYSLIEDGDYDLAVSAFTKAINAADDDDQRKEAYLGRASALIRKNIGGVYGMVNMINQIINNSSSSSNQTIIDVIFGFKGDSAYSYANQFYSALMKNTNESYSIVSDLSNAMYYSSKSGDKINNTLQYIIALTFETVFKLFDTDADGVINTNTDLITVDPSFNPVFTHPEFTNSIMELQNIASVDFTNTTLSEASNLRITVTNGIAIVDILEVTVSNLKINVSGAESAYWTIYSLATNEEVFSEFVDDLENVYDTTFSLSNSNSVYYYLNNIEELLPALKSALVIMNAALSTYISILEISNSVDISQIDDVSDITQALATLSTDQLQALYDTITNLGTNEYGGVNLPDEFLGIPISNDSTVSSNYQYDDLVSFLSNQLGY